MKKLIRNIFRKILFIRKNETVQNGIERHKINIQKRFYKTKISKIELKSELQKLGITAGDNLIVHSSWRQFYNFDGTPEHLIAILKEILGENGTLVMPSYGVEKLYFNVKNTPSAAGVLSEVFRKSPGVLRSYCTHFSMAAWGKNAEYLTKDHFKSKYGFDLYSPYFKFISLKNSKILFLGLGKEPTKISLFHCVEPFLINKNNCVSNFLVEHYTSKLVIDEAEHKKDMVTRKKDCLNNNKVFKNIFREIKSRKIKKISNLDIVIFEAQEGFDKAKELAEKGVYCYK